MVMTVHTTVPVDDRDSQKDPAWPLGFFVPIALLDNCAPKTLPAPRLQPQEGQTGPFKCVKLHLQYPPSWVKQERKLWVSHRKT